MATKNEHPEKYAWWLNELESLGVSPKECSSEITDKQEVSDLAENLKQVYYQEYKTIYNKSNAKETEE
jgi:hypothetical protein